jgi:hypothetical protein
MIENSRLKASSNYATFNCFFKFFFKIQKEGIMNKLESVNKWIGAAALLATCAAYQPAAAQSNAAPAQHIFDAAALAKTLTELTPGTSTSNSIHIFPTVDRANALKPLLAASTPLIYHTGGPIMPSVNIYVIFWLPPKLQNGSATSLSKQYQDLQIRFMKDYPAHGIDNNNTQYYETVGARTNYINNVGQFVDSYVDTDPYPASGCKDVITPGNCITDAQLTAELQRVMALKKWNGGLTNIYFVYTGAGEGSCFDASSASCAYTSYCAYHSFIPGATPIIYANMPYADPKYCYLAGTQTSPNGVIDGDAAASVASHELTEAITDPLLNAWYSSTGAEIGDLCAWQFGTNSWGPNNNANQSWNGHLYELQLEWDNHVNAPDSCVALGPAQGGASAR